MTQTFSGWIQQYVKGNSFVTKLLQSISTWRVAAADTNAVVHNSFWPSNPFCVTKLGRPFFRYWFVVYWHQAIAGINVGLAQVRFGGVHLRIISQRVPRFQNCPWQIIATSPRVKWVNAVLLHSLPHCCLSTSEYNNKKTHYLCNSCARWWPSTFLVDYRTILIILNNTEM